MAIQKTTSVFFSYLKKTSWSWLSARNRRLGLNTAKSTTYFRPRL